MPAVLTAGSVVQCSHNGRLIISASQRLLTVDGQPVLVQSDLLAGSFTPCANNGGGRKPCLKVASIGAGLSSTLSVGGAPVVLADASGITDSTPPGTWRVSSVGHTKLEAAR
jgi:hypothetical protein